MTRIQHRRGTATQWTTANPILAGGELGYESDTGKFKIGNGTLAWNALPYFLDIEDMDVRYAPYGSGDGFSGDADDLVDGTTKVVMTVVERNKLANIQAGATANSSDATLKARANHTGTQAISTIVGLQDLLDQVALTQGGLGQFAGVTDELPQDGVSPVYDLASSEFQWLDLSTIYMQKDSSGRIAYSALPLGSVVAAVVEEGDSPPEWLPVGGWLATVGGAADLTPLVGGHAFATAANTTPAATVGQDFAVGDDIAIAVMSSAEATTPVSFTFAFSSGAATLTKRGTDAVSGTTAQVIWYTGKVTTIIPATATYTVNSNLPGTTTDQNRAHMHAVIVKPQNLITVGEPFDQAVSSTGVNSSTLTFSTGPTPVDTAQDRELALTVVGYNAGVTPAYRGVVAAGWTKLADFETETASSRAIAVFYKVIEAVGRPAFTGQFVSPTDPTLPPSDSQTGQWAAAEITLRGQ
jgi:hypothetical protein